MAGLYNLMDDLCAQELGVEIEEYIDVVENRLSFNRADVFIGGLLSEDAKKIEQCRRIYNNYLINGKRGL